MMMVQSIHGSRRRLGRGGVVVGLVVAAVGAVFLWRSALLAPAVPVDPADMTEAQYRRYSQREYGRYAMFDLARVEDAGQIRALWQPAAIEEERRSDAEELLGYISEFVWYRYLQDDVDVYKHWRSGRGYRLRDTDVLRTGLLVDSDYEEIFGEPYPGDDRIEEVFDRFWRMGLDFRAATGRPTRIRAVTTDSSAVGFAFGRITRENPTLWPTLTGKLGDLWYGRSQASMRDWWQPVPRTHMEALEQEGSLEWVVVGILMEYGPEDRRPTVYGFWKDPRTNRWNHVLTTNNNGHGGATEY